MLQTLAIKNVALIDSAVINFTEGLNVLSGETGAGKSVIIESLNFVLGAKADKTLIRSGQTECSVRAEFINNNISLTSLCEEFDVPVDDLLIITRKFNLDGKSTIKVNGVNVTVNMLKRLTSLLVDVHGQSEHFNLLKQANQLQLIDKFGDEKFNIVKKEIYEAYTKYKSILRDIDELGGDESQRLVRLDILNYQINEIKSAGVKEGEEQELIELKQKISNQEKIINALRSVKLAINEDGGASDTLSLAYRSLNTIAELNQEYLDLATRLDGVVSELGDIEEQISDLFEEIDSFDLSLDNVEERLDLIKNLNKKYGGDINAVNEFLYNAIKEKEKLENFNQIAEDLLKNKEQIETLLYNKYVELSNCRREIADKFSNNVLDELKGLGMPSAKFIASFNEQPKFNECEFNSTNGFDKVEFQFSANLGEPLKPLSMVISGGEMSRFMLSIKAQTAKFEEVPTFIFDEIDAGISGIVAKVVAEKFAKISRTVQLIAITHLPQISAMADNNLLITKNELEDKTVTIVHSLSPEEKIYEITRLIGGDVDSKSAKAHAVELINTANEYKSSLS